MYFIVRPKASWNLHRLVKFQEMSLSNDRWLWRERLWEKEGFYEESRNISFSEHGWCAVYCNHHQHKFQLKTVSVLAAA